jgi:hypothetical protein
MSLRLIYGRAGTGKSQFCLNKIKEQINNKTAQKIYLVVPEQFSFSTEKRLLETLEQNSVINAEVITFKRMAHRIFTEVGGLTEVNLSKTGKAMLVSNILEKYKKDLQFLNKSSENIDIVLRTITELKKHDVKLEDLEQKQKEAEDEYLKIKLNDINTIYKKYEETLQNKYIDEDDILTILAKKIEESSMFDNSYIYIDEFSGFTRQEYNVIKELLKNNDNKNILFDLKCSNIVREEVLKAGGNPTEFRTGASYTMAKVIEDKMLFGFEYSGHIYFNDLFPPISSGLYAGLKLVEILSNTNKDTTELLGNINTYYEEPEIRIHSDDDKKWDAAENRSGQGWLEGWSGYSDHYEDKSGHASNHDDCCGYGWEKQVGNHRLCGKHT